MREYTHYIVKKRMRGTAICGPVNIPWGTILPASGEAITTADGKTICMVRSHNARKYFWGYDPENPQAEIERQEAVAALLATAPNESGNELADPRNPWNKYGRLEETLAGWLWVWADAVEELTAAAAVYLLRCAKSGARPWEVPL